MGRGRKSTYPYQYLKALGVQIVASELVSCDANVPLPELFPGNNSSTVGLLMDLYYSAKNNKEPGNKERRLHTWLTALGMVDDAVCESTGWKNAVKIDKQIYGFRGKRGQFRLQFRLQSRMQVILHSADTPVPRPLLSPPGLIICPHPLAPLTLCVPWIIL